MKTGANKKAGSVVRTALTGILAAGVSSLIAGSANAAPGWAKGLAAPGWAKGLEKIEKCGGVAKAGKNDCGTKNHTCGGQAASDNLADEWIYTPVGVCEKIGGKVLETKKL